MFGSLCSAAYVRAALTALHHCCMTKAHKPPLLRSLDQVNEAFSQLSRDPLWLFTVIDKQPLATKVSWHGTQSDEQLMRHFVGCLDDALSLSAASTSPSDEGSTPSEPADITEQEAMYAYACCSDR